jgi:hypothetical protein
MHAVMCLVLIDSPCPRAVAFSCTKLIVAGNNFYCCIRRSKQQHVRVMQRIEWTHMAGFNHPFTV